MPQDSLSIGASGMDAYQAEIDVVSNNIANISTVGFKDQNLSFQDLLYQTQGAASAPSTTNAGVNPQQIGIGVKIGSTDTNESQGGVQTTGVNTNMMINGDGYFVLNNLTGTAAPTYTRDGDFSLNTNGTLYDPSSGLAVMGYTADSAGDITASGSPSAIQIPLGLKSEATATGAGAKVGPTGDKVFDVQYSGNLDSANYAAAVSNGAVSASYLSTGSTTIYDSLGDAHQVSITFQPVLSTTQTLPIQVDNSAGTAVTAATEWAYNITSTDGTEFSNGTTTSPTQYVFFDQSNNFINTSGNSAGTAVHAADASPSLTDGNQLQVIKWGTGTGANNSATDSTPGAIGLDFSQMSSNAQASAVSTPYQNGLAPGTLSNISVGTDGTITGAFTNGSSQTLARVAVATFQNEEGLTRNGSNQYSASSDSGSAILGTANSGRYGAIVSDSLEMSNVSLSDEFTKLITAQNAFSANSKSITTGNEDLQTVIGLIH